MPLTSVTPWFWLPFAMNLLECVSLLLTSESATVSFGTYSFIFLKQTSHLLQHTAFLVPPSVPCICYWREDSLLHVLVVA